MLSKAIITNITLSFGNIVIKFFLNFFLAHNVQEIDLIKYFTLIDVITILSMITVGFKDTLIRAIGIYGDSFSLYFFQKIGIFFIIFFVLLLPIAMYLISLSSISSFGYRLYVVEFMMLFFIVNLFITHFLLAFRKYQPVSYFEFLKGFLFVVCFFVFFYLFNDLDIFIILVSSFIISNVLIFIWLFPSLKNIYGEVINLNKPNTYFIDDERKAVILKSFSFSSLEYLSSSSIIYLSSVFMLILYGNSNVGDFQVVTRPIYLALITVFSYPIFRFLFPEFVKLLQERNLNQIKKIKKTLNFFISIGSLIIIFLCWGFSEMFVSKVFPEEYLNSYQYLNILVLALPFVVLTSVLFALIKSLQHFEATFIIRFFGLISFVLSLMILYLFDFNEISIVYSMVSSAIIMFICSYFYEKRIRQY